MSGPWTNKQTLWGNSAVPRDPQSSSGTMCVCEKHSTETYQSWLSPKELPFGFQVSELGQARGVCGLPWTCRVGF